MHDHIYWKDGSLYLLDQRHLPFKQELVRCRNLNDVVRAIKTMVVRGAPLIGVVAAYGVVIGVQDILDRKGPFRPRDMERICTKLGATRPTAVNLFWALTRMRNAYGHCGDNAGFLDFLTKEAMEIHREDVENNRTLSSYGSELIADGDTILTHCNAGALATGGYGTALGVIRAAFEKGKRIKVIATETRPYFQGARLTVFELHQQGIEVELVPDNHVGLLCSRKAVNKVIVGADRIARNGDTANKIGTFMVALCAHEYGIPFYVAAPASTFDRKIENGSFIEIEERDGREVKYLRKTPLTLEDVKARYYSFDVTPARYISAIITERGIAKKPFKKNIDLLFKPLP
jgi:methylthioribose-1-phosphate isomerase